jgi:hypothetical protein
MLEVSDPFLFLGIDRDHRITRRLVLGSQLGDRTELGIPIRMPPPFPRLAGRLQAIVNSTLSDYLSGPTL